MCTVATPSVAPRCLRRFAPRRVIAANGAEIWAPWRLVYAGAWSVLGFVGAWRLFHKLEFVFPEYI